MGKMMKPKNDRDSTPVTHMTAQSLTYLPKERPLSRGRWWFDGPNLTGCILRAKPRAGSRVDPLQMRLPNNQNSALPIHAEGQAEESPGYWHSGPAQSSSAIHTETATEPKSDLPRCCSPTVVADTEQKTCIDSASSDCSLDEHQTPSPPAATILPEVIPSPSIRLPRGLVIFSKAQSRLSKFHRGFKYPGAILSTYGINKADWSNFCDAMRAPLCFHDHDRFLDLRYIIDDILDVVSQWDRNVFRPKGLIVRIDMPGEAKYGLHFMDFYHKGHIDNCSGVLTRKVLNYEDRKHNKLDSNDRHLSRVLERGYCSTRIVIDELAILKNVRAASERGWIEWDRISNCALSIPPIGKHDPIRMQMDLPFDDRWCHSKHIYYEWYRGTTHQVIPIGTGNNLRAVPVWHPAHDSLDQRHGEYMLAKRAVLPADCLPPQGIKRDYLVYWEKWAIEILVKDGYYWSDTDTPPGNFSKRSCSDLQPPPSEPTVAPE